MGPLPLRTVFSQELEVLVGGLVHPSSNIVPQAKGHKVCATDIPHTKLCEAGPLASATPLLKQVQDCLDYVGVEHARE